MRKPDRLPRWLLGAAFLLVPCFLAAADQTPEEFLDGLRRALETDDRTAYLEAYAPESRDAERSLLADHLDREGLKSVRLERSGLRMEGSAGAQVFVNVLFENDYAASVEIWQLNLGLRDGRWQVVKKQVTGRVNNLFKVRLQPDPAGRAERVEIIHADIRITFTDAVVYHDNIPGLESALLVIGTGRVVFQPSDPAERHQLQVLYKKTSIEAGIEHVFIRCSDAFFKNRIVIQPADGEPVLAAGPAERARAEAIFEDAYSRSFTMRNSISGETLSFLPQGDEAVFEFKGKNIGEMTYVYFPYSAEEVNLYDRTRDRIVNLYSPRNPDGPDGRKLFVTIGKQFDVLDYQIDLDFDPDKSYLSVKAGIQFVSRTEGLDGLRLRLNPDFEILRVQDSEKRELFYTRDRLREVLYLYFPLPPAKGVPTRIEILYRGKIKPLPPMTDVVGQIIPDEGVIVFQPKYETHLFTGSTLWYPAPTDDDYFTSRIKIIIPPEFKCASNGVLIEQGRLKDMDKVVEFEKMGNSFSIFQTRLPVKSLAFIIGRFSRHEEGNEPVPMELLNSTDMMIAKKAQAEDARDILRSYIEWFGPYPYERLCVVRRPWPLNGGHSPASFVVLNEIPWIGTRPVRGEADSPVDLSRWREYFMAHEIAHQWWGQAVTWETYRDQWLSEGLSQFAAALYLRKRYGEDAFASILKKFSQWTKKKSDRGPIHLGSRLSYFDYQAFQAIVYDKAALVLNMLRDMLGDEAFFRGLKDFFDSRRYSPARTRQFLEAMEKASGVDLENFSQGWFFSYELPIVRATWIGEKAGNEHFLKVHIQQEEKTFVFPLWVEWRSAGKTFREKILVNGTSGDFRLKTVDRPSRVRFNPSNAVPGVFK